MHKAGIYNHSQMPDLRLSPSLVTHPKSPDRKGGAVHHRDRSLIPVWGSPGIFGKPFTGGGMGLWSHMYVQT